MAFISTPKRALPLGCRYHWHGGYHPWTGKWNVDFGFREVSAEQSVRPWWVACDLYWHRIHGPQPYVGNSRWSDRHLIIRDQKRCIVSPLALICWKSMKLGAIDHRTSAGKQLLQQRWMCQSWLLAVHRLVGTSRVAFAAWKASFASSVQATALFPSLGTSKSWLRWYRRSAACGKKRW